MFADKSTMGLAFEMAAVVLNSACASSSFSDMLLVGCFHYHVLPTRRLSLKWRTWCAPGPPSLHLPLEAHAQAFVIQERAKVSQPLTRKRRKTNLVKLNRKPTDQSVSGFNLTRFWGSIFGDAAWVLQAFSTCAPISVTLPGCYWHSLCLPPSRLRGLGTTGILFVCSHLGHAARPSL